jgi:K+-transporting ATPase KdpF subunit
MKTKIANSFLALVVVPINQEAANSSGTLSYLIGGIIAFLILCYLIYTLMRPDKF